ncbi:MAG: glycosyltransferase [Syntrophales bacterium]|nr:glycosyltransferase [Syntrophales bacterium]
MKKKKNREKNQTNRISLCMIVKNEEASIERCLESIHRFVDEIIIVDTGSTDKTCSIAEKYGAKIYYHPWENDFSKHRNQAISYATGNWILQVDADEELFDQDGHKLKATVNTGKADYYYCIFYDVDHNNSIKSIYNMVRLFRKGLGMRYVGKIHEQIEKRGKGAFSDIRFKHYGYYMDEQKIQIKLQQRRDMLSDAISEKPDDPYNYFQLAATYDFIGNLANTLMFGEIALELANKKNLCADYVLNIYYLLARCYLQLNDHGKSEHICLKALSIFPKSFDINYLLASIYFQERKWELCEKYGRQALATMDEILNKPSALGGSYLINVNEFYRIPLMLGYINCINKKLEEAEKYFLQAWEKSERNIKVAEEICLIYTRFGLTDFTSRWLETLWENRGEHEQTILHKSPELCLILARRFMQINKTENSEKCLELIDEEKLTDKQQITFSFLKMLLAWHKGDVSETISHLLFLHKKTELPIDFNINNIDDLGKIFFSLGEYFCRSKMWPEAKDAIKIGIIISPHFFVKERYLEILEKHNP